MADKLTQVYLMRHGSTLLNETSILQGRSQVLLSEKGREQIRSAGTWLQTKSIAAIYTSDMPRAVQSAEIIQRYTTAPLHTTLNLRERDYGIYDGLALEDVAQTRLNNGFPSQDTFHDWHGVDGVESDAAVYKRAWHFMSPLLQHHEGNSIVVITHSGVIQSILYGIYQIPPQRLFAFRIERGGIFHFVHRAGYMEMQAYYPDPTIFLRDNHDCNITICYYRELMAGY